MMEQHQSSSMELQTDKKPNFNNISIVKIQDPVKSIIHIEQTDFSVIIDNLINCLNWSRVEAQEHCRLYRNYLFLLVKYPEKILPPSKAISRFWRHHILDTKKYIKDCKMIFGHYLNYVPYEPIDKLNDSFSETKRLYLLEFGEELPQKSYRLRRLLRFFKFDL